MKNYKDYGTYTLQGTTTSAIYSLFVTHGTPMSNTRRLFFPKPKAFIIPTTDVRLPASNSQVYRQGKMLSLIKFWSPLSNRVLFSLA